MNEREANEAGLSLPCPAPLPKRRRALAAAEWVWREKRAFPNSNQELFAAQFVLGEDPCDPAVVDEPSGKLSIPRNELHAAEVQGTAQGVAQLEIIEPDSAFQGRLRGWLLSE
jgi:hypothetical protein